MKKYRISEVFVISLLFIMFTLPALAQVDTAWVRRYNGSADSSDCARDIRVDHSGNVYVTGYSHGSGTGSDYVTIKYFQDGDTAWIRRYHKGSDDAAKALAVGKEGNVYVTGYSFDVPSQEHIWITIGYNKYGATTWIREYSTSLRGAACDVAVDDSDHVYATGVINDSLLTMKFRNSGDTVWVRQYPDAACGFLAVHHSGSVYVVGNSNDTLRGPGGLIIKYKSNGDTAWVKIDTTCSWSVGTVDDSGYVYVSGGCDIAYGYCTRKYKSNGDTVWTRTTDDDAVVYDLAVDRFYNVFVTGRSYNQNGYRDYATIKYYPNGDEAWVMRYDTPHSNQDKAYAVAVDTSGNAYVTGYSVGIGTDYDYLTIGYAPDGETLWVRRYNGPGNGSDWAGSIAVDKLGNVYVTGEIFVDEGNYDYATIKYVQEEVFVEEENREEIVNSFLLSQNYPNPFNPQTVIEYALNSPSEVSIRIYNIKGRLVKTLINGHQEKGFHQISWDGKDEKGKKTSSGIYFYQFKARDCVETKKMVKLR